MSTVPATFCGICGWPISGPSCAACGAQSSARAEGCDATNLKTLAGPDAEDYPELKPAFIAWQQKDGPRYIRQCLQALGIEHPTCLQGDAHDWWIFIQDSAVVFIGLDRMRQEIAIESPILQLPRRRRVPLMRTLLQLNGNELRDTRFCLRGDIVVLVYTESFANLPPPRFIEAIREHALNADSFDDPLSLAFSARMLGPETQQADDPLSFLGTPLRLQTLKGKSQPPPTPTMTAPAQASAESGAHRGVAEGHAQVSLPQLEAFKGVSRLIRQSEDVLRFLKTHRAMQRNEKMMSRFLGAELYVNRALVFLIQVQYGADVPGLVMPLARAAASYMYLLPPLGSDQHGRHEVFLKACQEIINQQASLEAQLPVRIRSFASTSEAHGHFANLVAVIDSFEQPQIKHFLLTGMIAELVLRIKLADADAKRFRDVLRAAEGQGGNPRIIQLLRQEVDKVFR
jgi:hypothetical protein